MTAAEALSKARDVLAERGWCQRTYQDQDGRVCLVTALTYAAGVDEGEAWSEAYGLLGRVSGEPVLSAWNDDPSRSYEDVVLALKEAEELALEQEAAA